MLAWVKKRRRTIRREDLISFLCGKAPPHRSSRANPRLAMVAPSRANSPAETGSSVEADLQPFREAIALHGEDTYCLCYSVSQLTHQWPFLSPHQKLDSLHDTLTWLGRMSMVLLIHIFVFVCGHAHEQNLFTFDNGFCPGGSYHKWICESVRSLMILHHVCLLYGNQNIHVWDTRTLCFFTHISK